QHAAGRARSFSAAGSRLHSKLAAGSSKLSLVRKHPRQLARVGLVDRRHAAQLALALPALAAQNVLLERLAAKKLSGFCPLEALRGAPVCLDFRHLAHSPAESPQRTPWTQRDCVL